MMAYVQSLVQKCAAGCGRTAAFAIYNRRNGLLGRYCEICAHPVYRTAASRDGHPMTAVEAREALTRAREIV